VIYLNGINLVGTDLTELHKFADDVKLTRVWWSPDRECYDVICPFKLEFIQTKLKNYEIHNNRSRQTGK
jgi:hypothetical protein